VAVDALGCRQGARGDDAVALYRRISLADSREMVRLLGVRYDEINIGPAMQTFADLLQKEFAGLPADTTEETCRRASAAC
jgi:NH(3)-dependent NAD(+) synthetase (EC 6.3.1.5)